MVPFQLCISDNCHSSTKKQNSTSQLLFRSSSDLFAVVPEGVAVVSISIGIAVAIAVESVVRISISIGISVSSGLSLGVSAPLAVQVDEGVSWPVVGQAIVESMGISISISISISAPLAVEQMRQTMGGGADIAGSMARVDGDSSSVGLSTPLAKNMRVAMRQAKGGRSHVARSVAWVKGNTSSMGLGTTLADEMRGGVAMGETICGGANIAGGKTRVEGDSRLSATLANVRMAPDRGSHVAGGEAGVDGNSKTEAMRLGVGKDGGKKRGGENLRRDKIRKVKVEKEGKTYEELHVASAFLPTAGRRAVVRSGWLSRPFIPS